MMRTQHLDILPCGQIWTLSFGGFAARLLIWASDAAKAVSFICPEKPDDNDPNGAFISNWEERYELETRSNISRITKIGDGGAR